MPRRGNTVFVYNLKVRVKKDVDFPHYFLGRADPHLQPPESVQL